MSGFRFERSQILDFNTFRQSVLKYGMIGFADFGLSTFAKHQNPSKIQNFRFQEGFT